MARKHGHKKAHGHKGARGGHKNRVPDEVIENRLGKLNRLAKSRGIPHFSGKQEG